MNLRDGRHDGRIDLETAFERYRSRIPINDVDTVLALKKEINPETESAMKEFVEKYRPSRQRTVREELLGTRQGLYHGPSTRSNNIPSKWTYWRD